MCVWGGSECQQSEQENPVMSVTGEARVSEIMSLNIQVSSTGKTKIQQLLLGRVLESGCWSHPLFFCCCYFFYWWVSGYVSVFSPLPDLHPEPPEKGTAPLVLFVLTDRHTVQLFGSVRIQICIAHLHPNASAYWEYMVSLAVRGCT